MLRMLFAKKNLNFTVINQHLIQVQKLGFRQYQYSVFKPYNPETTISSKPDTTGIVTSKRKGFKTALQFISA